MFLKASTLYIMNKLFTKLNILILVVLFFGVGVVVLYNQYLATAAPEQIKPPLEYEKLDASLNYLVEEISDENKQQPELLLINRASPNELESEPEPEPTENFFLTSDSLTDEPNSEPKPAVRFFLSNKSNKKEIANLIKFLKDEQSEIIFSDEDNGYIEAYVPVSVLAIASEQPGVSVVRTIIPPQVDVTSQGVESHGADTWHTNPGVTGAGVKVGVIDAGFNEIQEQMGSELPATIKASCPVQNEGQWSTSSNISDCDTGPDHGTAVSEAIFDVAPGIDLYIAKTGTESQLQQAVEWLISEGVDVINMSVGYGWDGLGDGNSIYSWSPLKSVDLAVEAGIVWFNSAGNSNLGAWYGNFTDTDNDGWHEWENAAVSVADATTPDANETNAVTLSKSGECYVARLRWEDSWPGASTDLDIVLTESDGTELNVAGDTQTGEDSHWPREYSCLKATTAGEHNISIKRHSGEVPDWIQLVMRNRDLDIITNSGGILVPAEGKSPGMATVGAAYWNGVDTIRLYSSRGPTPDGRIKPDIVGADGGQSASKGNFRGTSQAAPHMAGLAALVLEQNPNLSPAEVIQYLTNSALPRESKVPNNTWGYGFSYLPSCNHACLP